MESRDHISARTRTGIEGETPVLINVCRELQKHVLWLDKIAAEMGGLRGT